MGRKVLAVCDSEPVYARCLMEWISRHGDASLQVRIFSDAGQLFQYSKKHEIEMLLMEECYPEEIRSKIPAKKKFLLCRESSAVKAGYGGSGEKGIFKYQSAEQIATQLMEEHPTEIYGKKEKAAARIPEVTVEKTLGEPSEKEAVKGGKGLIGIYSPVHRIGKTTFALKLAGELGGGMPVLYLNLEEYSGLEYCLPFCGKGNLGDLLYYMKQADDSFGYRLSTMVCQKGNLDYIEPLSVTMDLRAVKAEEWLELFRRILEESIYETVVLDLGEGVQGLFDILRQCDTVYTPFVEQEGARAKLRQYTDNLCRLGYEEVLEHTIQKELTR